MNKTEATGWMGWVKLALGLAAVWCFIFVLAPWVRTLEPVGAHLDFIKETGIDAAALFYTDSEESGDGESLIRDALKYDASR
jgi:hypothetical protein